MKSEKFKVILYVIYFYPVQLNFLKRSFATQDPFSRVQRQVENVFDLFMVVPSTASACQNVWAVFSYCSAEFQEV